MKKLITIFALVIPIFFSGCDKDDDVASSSAEQVSLNIDSNKLFMSYSITYSAVATGDGKLSQIKYLDDKGAMQTVSNPTLPWTKTLYIPADSSVAMSAQGTLSKGSLTINIDGTASGSTMHLDDSQSRN